MTSAGSDVLGDTTWQPRVVDGVGVEATAVEVVLAIEGRDSGLGIAGISSIVRTPRFRRFGSRSAVTELDSLSIFGMMLEDG